MEKINKIEISGIRGIKNILNLDLGKSKSVLIYGDNGSGKSSITDAMEWFYYDRVEHLSSEEIGRKGIEALRNIFIDDGQEAYMELKLSDSKFDSQKQLVLKRSKLDSKYSNASQEFKDYLEKSKNENIILRYRDLLRFILYTKGQKLQELSSIIGYSDVTKVKSVLKKLTNSIEKEIKNKDYSGSISQKQNLIMQEIKQPIPDDNEYFKALNEIIVPLKLDIKIENEKTIDSVLELIKEPENEEILSLQLSYGNCINILESIEPKIKKINNAYKRFYRSYQEISKDIDKFKKINLEKLLSEGLIILEKNIYSDNKCPLCLQDKSRDELINDLRIRIAELDSFKKEKDKLEDEKTSACQIMQKLISEIASLLDEKCLNIPDNKKRYKDIEDMNSAFSCHLEKLKQTDLLQRIELAKPDKFMLYKKSAAQDIINNFKAAVDKIKGEKKDEIKYTINNRIISIRGAYKEIIKFKKEEEIFKQQLQSMQSIYSLFLKKEKHAIDLFLNNISKDINEFYLFMNKDEEVDEIQLIPLGDENELEGITLQFKFHDKVVTPPNKYLSESHLNCLGICIFLSSVNYFNKNNKFIILDDIVSSFDSAHRARFPMLLDEKFKEYQIFLFTHQQDWFEYLVNMFKNKNWLIKRVYWHNGTEIDTPVAELAERIEYKINKSDSADLANMIRRYLERMLKEICYNLQVKLAFLYNEKNEKRSKNDLVCELKRTLNEKNCTLYNNKIYDNIIAANFFGDEGSHGDSENIGDLKTYYQIVKDLKSLFYCDKCNKYISVKYYDRSQKIIKCNCSDKNFSWGSSP